jgi:hypothetical protein
MPGNPEEIILNRIISKPFMEEERNGNHIRSEERCHIDRHNGVEICCTTNVDES